MNKNKKKLCILLIIFIIFLLILCIKKIFISENFNNQYEENIANIKNPYIKTEHESIVWQKLDSKFMKNNYPSNFEFDYKVKEDIINKALTLPKNTCIIDCGAHIGDGSIAIAHALKFHNREDIIVYAIDPSKYKCEFIEFIKNKNNLTNIKVLNYGLSNVNNIYKSDMINENNDNTNTGSWMWKLIDDKDTSNDNNNNNDNYNINKFIKLDDLVKDKIITENIGILHLDVEGMEKEALIGGNDTITKDKPYLSIENNYKSGKDINGNENSNNNEYYLEFLPKGYKYIYNQELNNILVHE